MRTQLIRLRSTLLRLPGAALLAAAVIVPAPGVQWDFNGTLVPTLGTINLEPGFAARTGAAGVSFNTAPIARQTAPVASFTRGTRLRLTHNLPAHIGDTSVNRYMLIMDVMFPSRPAGLSTALFATSPAFRFLRLGQ